MKATVSWFSLITTCIVACWTCYSIIEICFAMEHDLCKDEYDLKRCSTWSDLTNTLMQIVIGVTLFFVGKNYSKEILMLPVFFAFTGLAMYAMFHAGRVNSLRFEWWSVMTLIEMVLIVIATNRKRQSN